MVGELFETYHAALIGERPISMNLFLQLVDLFRHLQQADPTSGFPPMTTILNLVYTLCDVRYIPTEDEDEDQISQKVMEAYRDLFFLLTIFDFLHLRYDLEDINNINPDNVIQKIAIIKAELLVAIDTGKVEFQSTYDEHMSTDRQLIVTAKGFIGCSSLSVMPGDQVWILPGMSTPAVLRKRENGRFLFINAAYVHGIMHGEAVENGQVEFQDIEIE
jgi:hypothetical protein